MRPVTLLAVVLCFIVAVKVPSVSATRYLVGGNMGWATSGVNYTVWASDKHFYLGDWLYFVYDRHQTNVLEVSKTSYENCISEHPLANWTSVTGRDVVHLSQTRHYYFINGNGFCWGGLKLAVKVLQPPPPSTFPVENNDVQSSPSPSASPVKSDSQSTHPPSASPAKSAAQSSSSPLASPVMYAPQRSTSPSPSPVKNAALSSSYRRNFVLPFAFAIDAIWDPFREFHIFSKIYIEFQNKYVFFSKLNCVKALSKRIHYGKYFAEAKFQASPETYAAAIATQDDAKLIELRTYSEVEIAVKKRVEMKARTFGLEVPINPDASSESEPVYKIRPSIVGDLYAEWIMPLTKKVQVAYLLRRLD